MLPNLSLKPEWHNNIAAADELLTAQWYSAHAVLQFCSFSVISLYIILRSSTHIFLDEPVLNHRELFRCDHSFQKLSRVFVSSFKGNRKTNVNSCCHLQRIITFCTSRPLPAQSDSCNRNRVQTHEQFYSLQLKRVINWAVGSFRD